MNKLIIITVYGKVQGVFFRASTKAVADQIGIKGIVKNQPDDSVYIEAEGSESDLEAFVEWCHEGPENALVEKVEVKSGKAKNYLNFEVLRK